MSNAAPLPTEFNEDYFRRMADLEDRHAWTASMRELTFMLLERYTRSPLERVLDAGCGTGLFLSQWKARHPGGYSVGIDFFLEALRFAARREPGRWVAASAAALPFKPAQFDAIHCADVLQHLGLDESRRAFDLFAELLRPQGLVALRVRARRLFRNTPDVDYSHAFSSRRLRAELQARGLRVRFLAHVNALPSLCAELRTLAAPPHDSGEPVKGIHSRPQDDPRNVWIGRYLRMERGLLLAAGRGLPFGHTIIAIAQKAPVQQR